MAAQSLVARLFERLGEQAVAKDSTVCEYVAGVLSENDSLEVEELRDLLEGFSPCFSELKYEEQTEIVVDLIREAQGAREKATPRVSVAQPKCAAVLASELRSLSLIAPEQQEEAQQPPSPEADVAFAEAVALLQGLCGAALPEGFLRHVLAVKCVGDMEAAAAFLLDSADLAAEQQAWVEAEAKRQLEREQAEQNKRINRQKILNKFQLEAVAEGPPRKPQQISTWTAKNENNSKARFRDGRIVSTKGEKYIIEKPEEWDGGSKGKVYTKGKRGKGFV